MIEPGFMNLSVLKERRRLLRKNPTKAEEFLWKYLKKNSLGIKFSRQVGNFIADFCWREGKLIIEVDGEIHDDLKNSENDTIREGVLKDCGYKILRFKNKEVLESTKEVLEKIKSNLFPPPNPGGGG